MVGSWIQLDKNRHESCTRAYSSGILRNDFLDVFECTWTVVICQCHSSRLSSIDILQEACTCNTPGFQACAVEITDLLDLERPQDKIHTHLDGGDISRCLGRMNPSRDSPFSVMMMGGRGRMLRSGPGVKVYVERPPIEPSILQTGSIIRGSPATSYHFVRAVMVCAKRGRCCMLRCREALSASLTRAHCGTADAVDRAREGTNEIQRVPCYRRTLECQRLKPRA